jgi:hypothetical protein
MEEMHNSQKLLDIAVVKSTRMDVWFPGRNMKKPILRHSSTEL